VVSLSPFSEVTNQARDGPPRRGHADDSNRVRSDCELSMAMIANPSPRFRIRFGLRNNALSGGNDGQMYNLAGQGQPNTWRANSLQARTWY
jgi:hypothetical protein